MRLLYFALIGFFVSSLTRYVFENTTVFKQLDHSLIIKPNYTPLVPRFIIRGIFACIAIAIFLGTLVNAVNHRRFDEEMIAIVFLVLLTGYGLWVLFKKTRKTLNMVVIPITIMDRRREAIAIGKDVKLAIRDIVAVHLQTVEIVGDYIVIKYSLKSNQDQNEHLICNRVYAKNDFLRNNHQDVKIILSYLVSSSTQLTDYLVKIDWDRLQGMLGHQEIIQL